MSTSNNSDYYPYNVVPQVRSPKPDGPMPNLKCPPDDKQQFILFDGPSLAVIKGWEWKANVPLSNFFVPVNSYNSQEFLLEFDEDFTKYAVINNVESLFLMIMPVYIESEIEDQNDWKLYWRFADDPEWINETGDDSPEDEDTWRELGRILVLSGTSNKKLQPILLQNRTGYEIPIKVLIGK